MPTPGEHEDRIRFAEFELDLRTIELRKNGQKLNVQGQPLLILSMLIERRGKLVTRDELAKMLWPDIIVDFENGLNRAVNRLRIALEDSTEDPRFIETLPGRGYRFIAAVDPPTVVVGPSRRNGSETNKSSVQTSLPNQIQREEFSHDCVGTHTETESGWIERQSSVLRNVSTGWMILFALSVMVLVLATVKSLPSIARYFNNRGVRYQQSSQIKAAIESYQTALRLNPGYAEAHYNLGDAYEEIPNYEKAVQEYQRAIEADPTFYEAYNNLSRLYILRRRDYEGALGLLDRAMNLKPQELSVQYSLRKNYGWANFELHFWAQAEHDLRFAVNLNRNGGAAHCLLAKVLDEQGTATNALDEWGACAAYSSQPEVEAEWRVEAQERLRKETLK